MKPDFEKQLKERLEQAQLSELAPGFDAEGEWAQLSHRMGEQGKKRWAINWSYAAAILLLIVAGSFFAWQQLSTPAQQAVVQNNVPSLPANDQGGSDSFSNVASPIAATAVDTSTNTTGDNVAIIKKRLPPVKPGIPAKTYQTKEMICNGTPCPIQICISQTMKCPNAQPRPIATCATLEAEESVKLDYKDHNQVAKNCSLTINEIEIKSIATGETILLNATSAPYTAKDVFSYITGEKKGDILAGVFRHDCDEHNKKTGLRLDNSYGDIIIRQ